MNIHEHQAKDILKDFGIKNLKIISIFRNPIDMVNSWINLDLAVTEKEILNQIPLLKNKKNSRKERKTNYESDERVNGIFTDPTACQ